MAKSVKSIRFDDNLVRLIENRIKFDPGSDFSTFITNAAKAALIIDNPTHKVLFDVYAKLGEAIQHFEILRDYEPNDRDTAEEFTTQHKESLECLYRAFDAIREAPLFLEFELAGD